MNMYNEALAMKDTLTADRRHFHQNPELGLEPVSYTHLTLPTKA